VGFGLVILSFFLFWFLFYFSWFLFLILTRFL
jgi:hypothetical protein